MAKKTTKKNAVTPDPKGVKTGIAFEDLSEGDYFIMDGQLWQRVEEAQLYQPAVNVLTGETSEDLCGEKIIPVTVTITWEIK